MSALARSSHVLRFCQVAVLTGAFAACATAQDPEIDETSTGNAPAVGGGGGGGGGGAPSASGGHAGTLPLAGTTSFPSGGSGTATGGKPSGGAAATGGAAPTAGTSSTPTGGTGSSSTCPQYAGTQAKDSTIFNGGYGTAKTGMWKGYGFTFKYGTATIAPGMGQDCFMGLKMCANGTVPADDTAGAGIGWNISQAAGTSTTAKAAITTPVKVSLAGATAGMRVQLSASSTVQYCYTLTVGTGETIPLKSFRTNCWEDATSTTSKAYDGTTPIEAIQIVVPGAMAAAKTFDFCVLDVEPG
jgi:hypothetical protein